MTRCGVPPYEGDETYIYIGYCHADRETVYPIIEQMTRDGCRVWYDDGSLSGADRTEIIAKHINGCLACIAFISGNSLQSHDCRKEINSALLQKKPFISVFLEKVMLSTGMEMLLALTQSMWLYQYDSQRQFLNKLYQGGLALCNDKEEAVSTRRRFLLLRRQSGERIEITETPFKVGRKRELCDYCIENNKTVSRVHVILKISENGRLTVFDNRSLNKVYVNGKRIPSLTDTPLFDGDEIRLGSERFIVTEEK